MVFNELRWGYYFPAPFPFPFPPSFFACVFPSSRSLPSQSTVHYGFHRFDPKRGQTPVQSAGATRTCGLRTVILFNLLSVFWAFLEGESSFFPLFIAYMCKALPLGCSRGAFPLPTRLPSAFPVSLCVQPTTKTLHVCDTFSTGFSLFSSRVLQS